MLLRMERRQSNNVLEKLGCIELAISWTPEAMKKAVPTFKDPEKVNKHAERSEEMKMTNAQ